MYNVHPLLSILCKHHLFILERVTIRLTVGGRGKGGEGGGGGTRGEDGRIRWGWSLWRREEGVAPLGGRERGP